MFASGGGIGITNQRPHIKYNKVIENQDVIINGDRFTAIGSFPLRTGKFEIDGTGKYLIPGLIDAHVHIRETKNLPLFLLHGVTVVRDMGGQIGRPLNWRDSVENGYLIGPQIISASPIISDIDSNASYYYPKSMAHAQRSVRSFKKEGYNWIKTFTLSSEMFQVIAKEAVNLDIPFGGHLPYNYSLDEKENAQNPSIFEVIKSRMTSIEHVDGLVIYLAFRPDEEIEALADSLIKYNVTVSTVTWQDRLISRLIKGESEYEFENLDSLVFKYAGEEGSARFKQQSEFLKNNAPPQAVEFTRIVPGETRRVLNIFVQKGVKLVAGTDAHNGPNISGLGLLMELESLVEYGIPENKVLQMATMNAGKLLNLSN